MQKLRDNQGETSMFLKGNERISGREVEKCGDPSSPLGPQDDSKRGGGLSAALGGRRALRARREIWPLTPTRKTWGPVPAPAGESAGSKLPSPARGEGWGLHETATNLSPRRGPGLREIAAYAGMTLTYARNVLVTTAASAQTEPAGRLWW